MNQMKANTDPFILIAGMAIILALLVLNTCNCSRANKAERRASDADRRVAAIKDTCVNWKTVTDTHYIKSQDIVYVKVPEPVLVEVPRYISTEKVVYRSGEVIEPPPDTLIKTMFFSKKYYRDSVAVKYGSVIISDTITQNTITGRSVSSDLDIPVLTNNIFVPEKLKAYGYLNLSSQFIENKFNAAGLGFTLLARNRKHQYSADVFFDTQRRIFWQTGLKFRLNK